MTMTRLRTGFGACLLLMAATLSACANLNPIAVAETPEQKYAAVKLTYDALLTPAVQLVENTAVPNDLRRAMQDAIARSGETYKALNAAYADYVVARETFTGADREQRLAVVAASLDGWITQLGQHVDAIAGGLRD
jgi:hypothetical protein